MTIVYSVLTKAPSIIFGLVCGVIGVGAAIWPKFFSETIGSALSTELVMWIGFTFVALSTVHFALLWFLKPTNGGDGADMTVILARGDNSQNVGANYGNITNNHAPEKFSKEFELTTLPPQLGGQMLMNLDNVATLKLGAPYSLSSATLTLDPVVMKPRVNTSPSVQVSDFQVTTGKHRTFSFDTGENKRHTMDAGGKVFIVTLREIEQLKVDGVANPLKFVFTVKEA